MHHVVRCCAVIGALLAPLSAYAQQTGTKAAPARSVQLPEELSPDAAFAQQLAFLRADLLIADALVRERDWVDALPHAQFPREEIYGVIREDLRGYKVPAFDSDLRQLALAIRARNVKLYRHSLARIEAALAVADKSLKARQGDWPRFTVQVALTALDRAAEEYDIAVVKGRIVHPEGYQSARGVVLEADRMIGTVAEALTAKNAGALQTLRGSLMRLKEAFAPLAAPKQAPVERAAVQSLVNDARSAARTLM